MGTQFKRMTDSFEAQWDSYAELQSLPAFKFAYPRGSQMGPIKRARYHSGGEALQYIPN